MKLGVYIIALVALLLLFASSVQAITRYVRNGAGNGCSNGNINYNPITDTCGIGGAAQIYTTLTAVVSVTQAGDTILMRTGTYNTYFDGRAGQQNSNAVPGTAGAPITVAAYPGNCFTAGTTGPGSNCEVVTIQPASQVESVLGMATGSVQYNGGLQYWVFDGLRINATAAYYGISPGSNNTFKNMDIYNMNVTNNYSTQAGIGIFIQSERTGIMMDNIKIHDATTNLSPFGFGAMGIYWQGSNSTLQNSEIYNMRGYGMQLYCNTVDDTCTGGMSNNTVKNNKIHNTGPAGDGIEVRSQPGALPQKVYNNLVYANAGRGIGVRSQGGAAHLIYSNTVYGNASAGISLSFGTGHQIKNNIVWGNDTNKALGGADFYDDGVGGSATATNNLCAIVSGSGFGATPCSVMSNPLFVSAGSDFRLQTGSPAINVGTSNIAPGVTIPACSGGTITNCYNGTAPDIGALETGVPTAGGGPPTLTPDLTTVVAGQVIKVTVDDDDVNERIEDIGDYVELHAPGTAQSGFVDFFYMNNTKTAPTTPISDAVLTFTAPLIPGPYEFRFYQNGSTLDADKLATATFTVVAPGIIMKFNITALKIGPSVTWEIGTP